MIIVLGKHSEDSHPRESVPSAATRNASISNEVIFPDPKFGQRILEVLVVRVQLLVVVSAARRGAVIHRSEDPNLFELPERSAVVRLPCRISACVRMSISLCLSSKKHSELRNRSCRKMTSPLRSLVSNELALQETRRGAVSLFQSFQWLSRISVVPQLIQ